MDELIILCQNQCQASKIDRIRKPYLSIFKGHAWLHEGALASRNIKPNLLLDTTFLLAVPILVVAPVSFGLYIT